VVKASNVFMFVGRDGACEVTLSSAPDGLSGYGLR
jgi:hypothetical protein